MLPYCKRREPVVVVSNKLMYMYRISDRITETKTKTKRTTTESRQFLLLTETENITWCKNEK